MNSNEPAGRAPLVLLPGLLCDRALWSRLAKSLWEEVEPFFIDLSSQQSIASMADTVLAQAPAHFALAGFSMGGQVAMEVAARAPERVARLALMSTNSAGLTPGVREHLGRSIDRIAREGVASYLDDAFPLYVSPARVGDADLRRAFVDMGLRLGPAVAERQLRALLAYPGFDPKLQDIRCPTTMICGALDARTPPPLHAAMAAQVAGATLERIEDAAHFTMLEAPGAVTGALRRWLRPSAD